MGWMDGLMDRSIGTSGFQLVRKLVVVHIDISMLARFIWWMQWMDG
jgi:hypothetical protein